MLIGLVLLGAGLYLTAVAVLYSAQRRLIYFPDATRHSPAGAGLPDVEETFLDTPDGERLTAWRRLAAPGAPTLLYFTGNGGGLIDRAARIRLLASAGYGVFMPAYRGYSGSTGRPSQKALVNDALLAFDHLVSSGVSPDEIVIYGESIGTGVASQTAARRRAAAVILEAPFSSLIDAASVHFPFFPVRLLLADPFDSQSVIARIGAPLLIIHGARDQTVPIRLGRKLFEAAREPKQFVTLPNAGHNNTFSFGAMTYVKSFLDQRLR
jgi:fermentation-respiration switch protein FrsA (DUF1100 family)